VNLFLSIPASGQLLRRCSLLLVFILFAVPVFPSRSPLSHPGSIAEITAKGAQRRVGSMYIADDDVDVTYGGMRLRADHVEYNDSTSQVIARGHIIFDFESQHLEADEANYNVATGRGTFKKSAAS